MNDRPSRAAPKRLTGSGPAPSVGLITDYLDDTYHLQIMRGAMSAAHERGSHLVCFVTGPLATLEEADDVNRLFCVARPTNIDALVTLSGSLANNIGAKGLAAFIERYRPMPVCSMAVPVAEASSVCIDNATGMKLAVEHLVHAHGKRRVGFVRGPAASDEAELRFRVYREVLDASGIPFDPQIVALGDFTKPAGRQAVHTFLDERKIPPSEISAIVAANDSMAIGVFEELRAHQIRVPEHMAVVGFDDIEQARFTAPPLTTVRQPFRAQGADAVRLVLDQLLAKVGPEQASRSTELVVRRSCGCIAGSTGERRTSAPPPGGNVSFDSALIRRRQQIITDLARAGRGELGVAGAQWEMRLLGAAADQIRGESTDAFLLAYDDLLRRLLLADARGFDACNDVLTMLRARLVRCISDPKQRLLAEDLFQQARIMTTSAIESLHVERRMLAWTQASSLMRAGAAMLAARDLDELSRAVHEHLPRIGIPRCFVIRLESGAEGELAQVVLAEKPDARKSDMALSAKHPVTGVLRSAVLPGLGEHAFAVYPMRFAGGERALTVVEVGGLEDFGYEALRQILAATLGRMPAGRAPERVDSGHPVARS